MATDKNVTMIQKEDKAFVRSLRALTPEKKVLNHRLGFAGETGNKIRLIFSYQRHFKREWKRVCY